jgi:hypothetical protein
MSKSLSAETSEAATTKSNNKEDVFQNTNCGCLGVFSHGNYSQHM